MPEPIRWIVIASFIVCIGQIIYALFLLPSDDDELLIPLWESLCFRCVLTSAALTLWLTLALSLMTFASLGDHDHWLFHYGWVIALLISLTATAIAASRISTNGVTRRFLRLQLWSSLALILAFSAVVG